MTPAPVSAADLESAIRNVPDFPKPGIQFKDITPLLANERLLSGAIDLMTAGFKPGEQVAIALDIAASEFGENGRYTLGLEKRELGSDVRRLRVAAPSVVFRGESFAETDAGDELDAKTDFDAERDCIAVNDTPDGGCKFS